MAIVANPLRQRTYIQLTNKEAMTKQDVIKQAYQDAGVDWEQVKEYVDNDGWHMWAKREPMEKLNGDVFDYAGFNHDYKSYRPKSLAGIEDNNGWIKIESEDDLPKDYAPCHFFVKGVVKTGHYDGEFLFRVGDSGYRESVTHYQPINKPEKPLY